MEEKEEEECLVGFCFLRTRRAGESLDHVLALGNGHDGDTRDFADASFEVSVVGLERGC